LALAAATVFNIQTMRNMRPDTRFGVCLSKQENDM
jgi:hypothetical protein